MRPSKIQSLAKLSMKSKLVAYLLLVLFGGLGVHRFYIRQAGVGIAWIGATFLSVILPPIAVLAFVALIVDGCLLWRDVDNYNDKVSELYLDFYGNGEE